VYVGNSLRNAATDGVVGIGCYAGCTVLDSPLDGGQSSVVIQGQSVFDIFALGGNVTLMSNPVLGIPPTGNGIGTCGIKHDHTAAFVVSGGSLSLSNAVIQCMSFSGVELLSIGNATVSNCVIRNCGQGILNALGVTMVTGSTIAFNSIGVYEVEDNPGTVDLSGGGNTVVCSSASEGGTAFGGIDVLNGGTETINASNVAWDTPGPDFFTCGTDLTDFSTCTCNLASCSTSAGRDGMDAVTVDAGITTTGNTVSPLALDAGCQ
jgi:hypothetical protein